MSEIATKLGSLQGLIDVLNGADTVTGSVAKSLKDAIGAWPTYTQNTNSFSDNGSGIYQAVADKIDASIDDLQGSGITTSYDTLVELQAAILLLEGSAGTDNSVLNDIADQISALVTGFLAGPGANYTVSQASCLLYTSDAADE